MLDFLMALVLRPLASSKLNTGVPFANNTGISIDLGTKGAATARIKAQEKLMTEEGIWEDAAVFTLAETASGATMTSALLPAIIKARPVVSKASFSMRDHTREDLLAIGQLSDRADTILSELRRSKKVEFPISVTVYGEHSKQHIADMSVYWNVRL